MKLFLSFVLFILSTQVFAYPDDIVGMAWENYTICALTPTDIVCKGSGGTSRSISGFKNAKQIGSGQGFMCVLDDDGVWCWGPNPSGTPPGGLVNPRFMSVRDRNGCAVDEYGVMCWGNNSYHQIDVPPGLEQPSIVGVGTGSACAVDKSTLVCWGYKFGARKTFTIPFDIGTPKKVVIGDQTCVLGSEGLYCIEPFHSGWTDLIRLGEIDDIDTYGWRFCLTQKNKLYCGSREMQPTAYGSGRHIVLETRGQLVATNDQIYDLQWTDERRELQFYKTRLIDPEDIALGRKSACVKDKGLLKCWGNLDIAGIPIEEDTLFSTVGFDTFCYVANKRQLKCLNSDTRTLYVTREFSGDVTQLELEPRGEAGCAVIGTAAECWGSENIRIENVKRLVGRGPEVYLDTNNRLQFRRQMNLIPPPPVNLQNPVAIGVDASGSGCLSDLGVVHCWGHGVTKNIDTSALVNMRYFYSEYRNACALDDHGIHCYSLMPDNFDQIPADVGNVKKFLFSDKNACAISEDGSVRCWGDIYGSIVNVPRQQRIKSGTIERNSLNSSNWGAL